MDKIMKKEKTVIRFCPCPSYDIFGMEKWLEEQAEKGLLLAKDGLFGDLATFERAEPRHVKYRLEAAEKGTGMWSENGGEPDPEEIELSQAYSWEYIAKRKDFFIYRTFDESARELNTDPEAQAIALNAVKKRRRGALISSVIFLVVYPLLVIRGCVVLTAITMGTWWLLLALLFALLMTVSELRAYLHLRKLRNKLAEGDPDPEGSAGRKPVLPYFAWKIIRVVLALILIGAILRSWGLTVADEGGTPIAEYKGELPFATMRDLAGEGWTDYTETMTGMGAKYHSVKEAGNRLAPRVLDYNEHASLKKADGLYLSGGLYVEYYEMRSDFLGKILEGELLRLDKLKKGFELINAPSFLAEKAIVYINEVHFPTILFRKGNVVVRAYFYQVTDFYSMPVEEWGVILYESVQGP